MSRSSLHRLAPSLVLVATLAALGACGDDSSSASTPTSPSTSPSTSTAGAGAQGPAEVVRALVQAYADGDGTAACALQTPEYSRSEVDKAVADELLEPGATCEESVERTQEIAKSLGMDLDDAVAAADVEVLDESADRARVRITYAAAPDDGGEADDEYPAEDDVSTLDLVRRDGAWLVAGEVA